MLFCHFKYEQQNKQSIFSKGIQNLHKQCSVIQCTKTEGYIKKSKSELVE